MKKKKALKTVLIVLLSIVVIFVLLVVGIGLYLNGVPVTHKGSKYIDKYRNDELGDCVYFTEDDFGNYEKMTYSVKDHTGLFRSVGSVYEVTYSADQYTAQLDKVNSLAFLDDTYQQTSGEDEEYYEPYYVIPDIIPVAQVEKNGWLVRILNNGEENDYPKNIAMIATNDEEKTIAYMYFTDPDLDFIEQPEDGSNALEKFIRKYFAFKF